ncbi:MAG TPA: permease-like cell division protein FtsX [candidate division Zixibacteria bacterium]|nr:permease-like cell division protein FtsX [candidate division Zixibacteria bacterium]
MRLFFYILRELGRNMGRHWSIVFGSFLSMMLLFVLFDFFWIAAGTSQKFYDRLIADLKMEVVLTEEPADSLIAPLMDRVRELPGVISVRFVSKENAREELSYLVGTDLLAGYDSINPLPRSLVLGFDPNYLHSRHLELVENELHAMEGVDQTFYSRRWLAKVEQTTGLIQDIGSLLGILILLAALISSANNIRLMTQTRAVGFAQMRLLGAGKLFLAMPFILEGLLVAGLAAALGWCLIDYGLSRVTFTQFEIVMPDLSQIAWFVFSCTLLGLVSGYVGIRKMLR